MSVQAYHGIETTDGSAPTEYDEQDLKLKSEASRDVSWGRRREDNRIGIGLIDERALTRESLSHLLSQCGREFKFCSFGSVAELTKVHAGECADLRLVLWSIGSARINNEPHLWEAIERLQGALVEIPLLILSDCEEVDCISHAFRLGVRGYIPTRCAASVVVEALRLVAAGGNFIPADLLLQVLEGQPPSMVAGQPITPIKPKALQSLTPRQGEVLDRLSRGMSNKLIGYELKMQESTVKVHVRHIMKKLNATNRTQAALAAQACAS